VHETSIELVQFPVDVFAGAVFDRITRFCDGKTDTPFVQSYWEHWARKSRQAALPWIHRHFTLDPFDDFFTAQ
jgi:hypothetical protein